MNYTTAKDDNQSSIVQEIYKKLRQEIIECLHPPGSIITENSVAQTFDVSRTPVREALRMLQQDEFLILIPRIGMQIAPLNISDVREHHEIRKALEELSLKLAIKNQTPDDIKELHQLATECINQDETHSHIVDYDLLFHQKIWKMTANTTLYKHLTVIQENEQRWWYYAKSKNHTITIIDTKDNNNSLFKIIKYIEARDLENAQQAIVTHIDFYLSQLRADFL